MTEQTEEHFEVIDRNKDRLLQRNKLKYLEDRLATLERSVGRINVLMHRFQVKEGLDNE